MPLNSSFDVQQWMLENNYQAPNAEMMPNFGYLPNMVSGGGGIPAFPYQPPPENIVVGMPPGLTPSFPTNPSTAPSTGVPPSTTPQGGGINWQALMGALGPILMGAGGIWGAQNQGQTNQANLAAQMAWQNQLLGMAQGQMQQGANPYAAQMMQFLGFNPQQFTPQTGGPPGGAPAAPPAGGGGNGLMPFGGPLVNMLQGPGGGFNPMGGLGGGPGGLLGGPPGGLTSGPPPAGSGPNIYQYQNPGAFTANPNTVNTALLPQVTIPGIGTTPQTPYGTLGAPGSYNLPTINPSPINPSGLLPLNNVNAPGQINPGQVNQPGQLNAPTVQATNIDLGSIGSSGFNTGQDSLMQMLRGTEFDTSGLLESLRPLDQQLIGDQVSDLRGSAGSLGQRLGSSMFDAESRLRGNFANTISARNADIQRQAFEASQGRTLQAGQSLMQGGLGSSELLARMAQSNAANQLTASQATAQNQLAAGLQGQQLGLQAGQFNVGTNLTAQQLQAQQAMQAQMANQQGGLGQNALLSQIMQSNQGNQLASGQSNLQALLQQGLQTQLLGQQGGQFNIGNQFNAGQFASQMQQQALLANQSTNLQAALANQGLLGQGMFQNANMLNNMGQFNAQQQMMNSQFGANQGNIFNQLMMGGLSQGNNMQQGQSGLNAQLLGILGGVGLPQQQPSAWPGAMQDMGQMAMLLPLLMGMNN